MKNVVIIACLLFGAFLVAVLYGADQAFAGRVGISAVFFFTALGHFANCAWPFRETRGDDAHAARWCAAAKVGDLA